MLKSEDCLFIMFTVGMKLTLLDPKLPIDLQYLGVQLPPLPPLHKGSDKMHPMSLSPPPGMYNTSLHFNFLMHLPAG